MTDISEARQLIAELEAIADRLKACDQRFVAGWRQYLDRTGDQARIGSKRLASLRARHADYFAAEKDGARRFA